MKRSLPYVLAVAALAAMFGAIGALGILLLHHTSKPEIWVPAIAALAGAVGAPYVAEFLRANLFIADLVVECQPREPWYATAITNVTENGQTVRLNTLERGVSYYRLSIENRGVVQAQDCEVILENVWVQHTGKWHSLGFWEPDGLIWSGYPRSVARRQVQRGRRVFADIGWVPTEEVLRVMAKGVTRDWPDDRPSGPRFLLTLQTAGVGSLPGLGPGRYILGVGVYAANADPRYVKIEILFAPEGFQKIMIGSFGGEGIPGVRVTRVAAAPERFDVIRSYIDLSGVLTSDSAVELE